MHTNQRGFGALAIVVIIAVVLLLGAAYWMSYGTNDQKIASNELPRAEMQTYVCGEFSVTYPEDWFAWSDSDSMCVIANVPQDELMPDLRAVRAPAEALVLTVASPIEGTLDAYLAGRDLLDKEPLAFAGGEGYVTREHGFDSDDQTVYYFKKGSAVIAAIPYPLNGETARLQSIAKSIR